MIYPAKALSTYLNFKLSKSEKGKKKNNRIKYELSTSALETARIIAYI